MVTLFVLTYRMNGLLGSRSLSNKQSNMCFFSSSFLILLLFLLLIRLFLCVRLRVFVFVEFFLSFY